VPSTLRSPTVASTLDRLHALADVEDVRAKQRVRDREAQLGGVRLSQPERYDLYGEAPQAITREVGQLLYVLTVSRMTRRVVEFGASLGLSTIYLAAALRDCEGDSLTTTECHTRKAILAQENLAAASLRDLIDLRVGDALKTLERLDGPVDLLFLDGRNDLYLPVLALVEPHLSPGALVVADLSAEDPDLLPYLGHVSDPDSRYFSICVPLDDGVELSMRLA
jgi:predicted O-methyltransferase YrrM